MSLRDEAGQEGLASVFTLVLNHVLFTDLKQDSKGNPAALMESVTLEALGNISFTAGGVTVSCNPARNLCE